MENGNNSNNELFENGNEVNSSNEDITSLKNDVNKSFLNILESIKNKKIEDEKDKLNLRFEMEFVEKNKGLYKEGLGNLLGIKKEEIGDNFNVNVENLENLFSKFSEDEVENKKWEEGNFKEYNLVENKIREFQNILTKNKKTIN